MKIDYKLSKNYFAISFWKPTSAEKLLEQMQEVDPEHPVFLRTRMRTEEKVQSLA